MINSVNGLFEATYDKLADMEENKEVDLSIMDNFAALKERFAKEESYWKHSRGPIKEAFTLFHSLRNCRIILEKMGLRFQLAKRMHQNPMIVHSARLVLPRINDLFEMIEPLKGEEVSANFMKLVKQRLKLLRDVAENTSMLPTVNEELRGVLKIELKTKFSEVASDLQAKISEE